MNQVIRKLPPILLLTEVRNSDIKDGSTTPEYDLFDQSKYAGIVG